MENTTDKWALQLRKVGMINGTHLVDQYCHDNIVEGVERAPAKGTFSRQYIDSDRPNILMVV